MREAHYLLPNDVCPFTMHPLGCHHWAQEEIAWGLRDAPNEMAVPSAMGRMLDGAVRAVGADILEDPMLALEQARNRVAAAERFRKISNTMKAITAEHRYTLEKVYGDSVSETDMLAFGAAANLFPDSRVAHDYYRRARVSMGFLSWAAQLGVRVAGERYDDPRIAGKYLRRPARATDAEVAVAEDIKRDMLTKLAIAVREYAMARPRR